jgi:hypothetical protein
MLKNIVPSKTGKQIDGFEETSEKQQRFGTHIAFTPVIHT